MWIGGTTAFVTGSIQPMAWAASDAAVTFFSAMPYPQKLTKDLRLMTISHRCMCVAGRGFCFFSGEGRAKIKYRIVLTRQGINIMDIELSGTQPQLHHAGRGDRVARTREAIVSS